MEEKNKTRSVVTYDEYKQYCYKQQKHPLPRKEMGDFINTNQFRYKDRSPQHLDRIFELLSEDGYMTQESLQKCLLKVNFKLRGTEEIFNILGSDKIDKELFKLYFC